MPSLPSSKVEKAHPDVFNILLQLLDDGRPQPPTLALRKFLPFGFGILGLPSRVVRASGVQVSSPSCVYVL